MRLLSPARPSGSSISAGGCVLKARAAQALTSAALLWDRSLSWMLAASLGRVVGSLEDFFLLTIFLPCKEGRRKPRHGADPSP